MPKVMSPRRVAKVNKIIDKSDKGNKQAQMGLRSILQRSLYEKDPGNERGKKFRKKLRSVGNRKSGTK